MNEYQAFVDKLAEHTGITTPRIVATYKESGLTDKTEIRQLFMDKFQLTYGYADTLVEMVLSMD